MTNINLIPVHPNTESLTPIFGTEFSACFDIKSDILNREIYIRDKNNMSDVIISNSETLELEPCKRVLIPTGFVFEIPDGYSMRLHPRSGLSWKKGISLSNCEGIIDQDYPFETFVMVCNNSYNSFTIKHGDRVAQAELVKMERCSFNIVDSNHVFRNTSDRVGGFGSTDV